MKLVLGAVLSQLLLFVTGEVGNVLFCYFASWSSWRTKDGAFHGGMIDPFLCTHVVYNYIGMNKTTFEVAMRDALSDYTHWSGKPNFTGWGNIERLKALKNRNPNLKLLVSIGGWGEGSTDYSKMAATPSLRRTLIDSLFKYLEENKFDGLDLDWEYPADRDSPPHDRQNLVTLLKELRSKLGTKYLLTVHLNGKKYIMDPGYNLPEIAKHVDYMSLVTYQYNHPKNLLTGVHAPLVDNGNELNLKFSVDYALTLGAPPEKLLMGFSTFGHTYILQNIVTDGVYFRLPSDETFEGPWSRESGFIGFNEVCHELKIAKWEEKWDDDTMTPYVVRHKKLISYENRESFKEKLRFLAGRGLAGAMVYSLDTDDFKGTCYGRRFPLINEIKSFLADPPNVPPEPPAPEAIIKTYNGQDKVMFCYVSSWAVWRGGDGKFHAGHIDPHLCSHIIYSYIGLNAETFEINIRDPQADFTNPEGPFMGYGNIPHLTKMKSEYPDLKVLISVGGYADGSASYSKMVSSAASRSTFINSVFKFVTDNQFDGLDINWEYPTERGGVPEDKNNFVILLKELREKLGEKYLLTVQIHGRRYFLDSSYDLKGIAEHVDFINFVVYHFTGPWDERTSINSPLSDSSELNAEFSVNYALKLGAPPEKILLGLSTYGHAYILDEEPENEEYLNKPAKNTFQGKWTTQAGFIGFFEICWELTRELSWKEVWDDETSTPYAINEKKFMSYDNVRSFKEKVKLIKKYNLRGAMIYTLDTDDFKGLCYGKRFPLTTAVKDYLLNQNTKTFLVINSTISNSDLF